METFPHPSDQLCKDLSEISLPFLKDRAQELKIEGLSRGFFKETIVPIGVYLNLFHQRDNPYLICLTGGQGSGKTTLLRAILGSTNIYGGEIFIERVPISAKRPRIGYVPQLETIDWNFPVTVEESTCLFDPENTRMRS